MPAMIHGEAYKYFKMPVYGTDEHRYNQYLGNHINKQNKGVRGQDSERQKTYRAEWTFQSKITNPEFASIEDAQKFAKKMYKSKTWVKLWGKAIESDVGRLFAAQPKVAAMSNRNKTQSGYTNGFTVTLDLVTGLNKYTLLHELAHCLGHMHHGRSFRQCLLSLVGTFMGANEKKILKEEFKKAKLKCGDARKPQTFEVWMESKKRMATMREANESMNDDIKFLHKMRSKGCV
tara:strand:+ start:1130 stop:1828 length:699 start_codon:yes stop_codon:yes gene_type:complete